MKVKELLKLLDIFNNTVTIFDEFARPICRINKDGFKHWNFESHDYCGEYENFEVKKYHIRPSHSNSCDIIVSVHGVFFDQEDIKRIPFLDISKYKFNNDDYSYNGYDIIKEKIMDKYGIKPLQRFFLANESGFPFVDDVFYFDAELNLYKNNESIVFETARYWSSSPTNFSIMDIINGEIITNIDDFWAENKYGNLIGTVNAVSLEQYTNYKQTVYYSSDFDTDLLSEGDNVYLTDPNFLTNNNATAAVCEKIINISYDGESKTIAKFVTPEPYAWRTVSLKNVRLGFGIRKYLQPQE